MKNQSCSFEEKIPLSTLVVIFHLCFEIEHEVLVPDAKMMRAVV